MSEPATQTVMEQIVALAKRCGFIYPASDIYGGIRGFWDYGPLGVLLKNNIRDHWWNWMVECPPIGPDGEIVEMVGLDSAIIQNPRTWIASGHVAGFNDPLVQCSACNHQFRADHVWVLLFANKEEWTKYQADRDQFDNEHATALTFDANFLHTGKDWDGIALTDEKKKEISERLADLNRLSPKEPPHIQITVIASGAGEAMESVEASARRRKDIVRRNLEPVLVYPLGSEHYDDAKTGCPDCEKVGTLGAPRAFNLMLDTYPGPIRAEENKAYLRPETAQGIFLNFKNIVDTTRVKVPFGVAQIGKSFRNEVTPRNFIFRSREFEQMEMEFFCPPDDALKWYEFWKAERMKWWLSLGVEPSRLKFRDHDADELSHYSKATVDIEYQYPFTAPDFGELEGIAHRGDFDLTQHQEHSKQNLSYFDQQVQLRLKEEGKSPEEIKHRSRYLPNVIEPASGLTRAVLVLLCEAFTIDASRPSGMYMKFKPKFAPIKLGIFPLVAKEGMPEKARELYMKLRTKFACEFDVKQSIGKRYARMDEVGTPFCVTIDGDTMTSEVVTIRDRDTQAQVKISIDEVGQYVQERLEA